MLGVSSPYFLRQPNPLVLLGWLAHVLQGSACLCLSAPNNRVLDISPRAQLLCGSRELGLSCLHKHFTITAISPAAKIFSYLKI